MAEKLADVIQYEGNNDTFVQKHPIEDFNTGTQLIVHESQEAVFFMNGQALDLFGPGRHGLETENLPYVSQFFNRPAGDVTPFHCAVYFVNKTEQMTVKWGTRSKAEYVEPTYGFPIQIGASGEMSLRADNSRKLLTKLVGTEKILTQQGLTEKFRIFLDTRVKAYLVQLLKTEKISIFEIDEYLTRMSEALHEKLCPDFLDYGIALERFFIGAFVKPEDDRAYQKFKELHFRQYAEVTEAKLRQQVGVIEQQTQAQRMVIEAEGLARKRATEGYTYQDERGFDVAERVASNEAVGQMTNLGVGLGMVTGVGGTVGSSVGGVMSDVFSAGLSGAGGRLEKSTARSACPKCGAVLPTDAKFCPKCGEKAPDAGGEIVCPACGKKTAWGKFCIECGALLARKCPNCGADTASGVKFCPKCGHKME
ncbi:MAG: SPFH domain-containing protein [Synergistaceae bacterium]|jgi:membrane protease subunit (stomatin/prohibitin family)|nr:SPFH domain-containing protein [Synergistaceae bacterium]